MGQAINHPDASGDEKLAYAIKKKILPGNIDPKKKWVELSAVEQHEVHAAVDKHAPKAEKDDEEKSKELDKKAAEVKAKHQKEREEAHKKDPSVRLDPTPGVMDVGLHKKPEGDADAKPSEGHDGEPVEEKGE
jgi:hypothetical protein